MSDFEEAILYAVTALMVVVLILFGGSLLLMSKGIDPGLFVVFTAIPLVGLMLLGAGKLGEYHADRRYK